MNIVSPITFIDRVVKKNELGEPFALTDEQREILRLAFAFDSDGRFSGTRSSTAASRRAARPR